MVSVVDFEQELRSRISGRRAITYIEELVAVGDRFVGSEGDRAAAEIIRAKYRTLGFDVEDRVFTTLGYTHTRCELRLARGESFDAIPPYFSPATPVDGVRGELVFVAGGEEQDYGGLDTAGKIVVIQETGLGYARFWMGTFAAQAARKDAVGVVVIHPLPWPYRMSMEAGNGKLESRFCEEQLPVVCVSGIDGARLMHAIGAGEPEATIVVESEMPEVESWLISGILRGREWPEGVEPRRSIEFLCTTAEEGVTKGIAAYIDAQREEGKLGDIRAAIDLDMFGTGGKLKLVELGLWPDCDPIPHTEWLMQMVERIADQLGYDVGRMTATWGVAESGRLIEAGVPAIWFWRPDDFYYHSVHDTVDKLDGNTLKAVADITATTVWQLANADELSREA